MIAIRTAALLLAVLGMALFAWAPAPASAATATQALLAFGENLRGELGTTVNSETETANPTPAFVALPGEVGAVTQVAGGSRYSLALTSSDQLYAFGNNFFGQLGNPGNDEAEKANPTPTPVMLPGQSGAITAIAASSHTLVATGGGQLYAFGDNDFGELGSKTNNKLTKPNPTPTPVTLPGQSGAVTQLAAGGEHSLAATAGGQLYAFGENQFGQLGNATNDKTEEPNPTPTLVTLTGLVGAVTQLAAGADDSFVVTSSGQLYAFGENFNGELGIKANEETAEPTPVPTLVALPGQIGGVTQVAAGNFHTLALTATGQLYAFGNNEYGQLGSTRNLGMPNANGPQLVALPGQIGAVTQIAAGAFDSLALTSSGQLYGFGENNFGELGTTTNNHTGNANPTPTPAALPPGVVIESVAAAAGGMHTLAIGSQLTIGSQLPAIVSPLLPSTVPRAPVLSDARQTHSIWREGNGLAKATRRTRRPLGTTFSFNLDEQATVSFSFTQRVDGRKVHGKCVAPSGRNRRSRGCRRTVTAGRLSFAGHDGTNHLAFEGRLSHSRRLRPGSYTLEIVATAAGRASQPVPLRFTIVTG